jgi:hypothetical protein
MCGALRGGVWGFGPRHDGLRGLASLGTCIRGNDGRSGWFVGYMLRGCLLRSSHTVGWEMRFYFDIIDVVEARVLMRKDPRCFNMMSTATTTGIIF